MTPTPIRPNYFNNMLAKTILESQLYNHNCFSSELARHHITHLLLGVRGGKTPASAYVGMNFALGCDKVAERGARTEVKGHVDSQNRLEEQSSEPLNRFLQSQPRVLNNEWSQERSKKFSFPS